MNSYITSIGTCITPILFDFEEPDKVEVIIPLALRQDLSQMVVRLNKEVPNKLTRDNDLSRFKEGGRIEKKIAVKRVRKFLY